VPAAPSALSYSLPGALSRSIGENAHRACAAAALAMRRWRA